jgi:hypothetical protein
MGGAVRGDRDAYLAYDHNERGTDASPQVLRDHRWHGLLRPMLAHIPQHWREHVPSCWRPPLHLRHMLAKGACGLVALLLATLIPAIPAAVGFAFGIARDGSPLHRDWWTS